MSSRRLKYLIKSKSLSFVKDLKDKSHNINSIIWNDKKVFYRSSTSDMTLMYEILFQSKYKSEYFFPDKLNPKVIFDIGGNIGITAIYLAASMGHLKMVEFIRNKLINKNPPLKITGRTPLHVAAQRGYLDIIDCIFECLWKEDKNPTDDIGITPLHLAVINGHFKIYNAIPLGCFNWSFFIRIPNIIIL